MINAQQITMQILKDIKDKIPVSQIKKGIESAALKTISIIQDRTMRGIDRDGKRLPAKKFHYELKNKKTGKITRIPSYFMKKSTGGGLKDLLGGKTTTEFKATKSPSHGRLTGQLFSGMRYQLTQNGDFGTKISGSFKIYVESKQAQKLEWLESETGATRLSTKSAMGVRGRGQNAGFWSSKKSPKKTYSKPSRKIWGLSTNLANRNKEIRMIEDSFLKELKYISRTTEFKIK